VLQINCRSVYNNAIELWSVVDTYNSDVVIGLRKILAMLNSSVLSLQLSEGIGLLVVMGFCLC